MSRSRRFLLCLPPIALLIILCDVAYRYPFPHFTDLSDSFLGSLLRKPGHCLIAMIGLIAPLSLCRAASYRFGPRRADRAFDAVGLILIQLTTIVIVQVSIFFGLIALGQATQVGFLAAQVGIWLVGRAAIRSQGLHAESSQGDPGPRRQVLNTYVLIVTTLTLCGVLSVQFGQDVGYDVHNYHYYNAHSLLNHRGSRDFAVSDWSVHFSPMLDVAYYLVVQSARPVWVGFIVGAAHGVSAVLLFGIALEVLGHSEALRPLRVPLAASCLLAGICEPMFLSELGTTFHDVLLASFILLALLLVLRIGYQEPHSTPRQVARIAAVAGLLVGIAMGFKLTNATYAVSLAVVLLATPQGWRRGLGFATVFSAAMVPGFLISNGYWMVDLYTRYGNPLFPFFNGLFKSPYWGDMNIKFDHMMIGFRWFDHFLVPFYLVKSTALLSEVASRDPRLAMLTVLLLLVALGRTVAFVRCRFGGAAPAPRELEGRARALIAFAIVSYVVWYKQFQVLRYFVVIKMLIPLICVLLLLVLLRTRRRVWVASTILLVVLAHQIEVPNFGRREWKKTFFDYQGVRAVTSEKNALVLLISSMEWPRMGQGLGGLVAELPREMRYIKIDSPQIINSWAGKPLSGTPLAMEEQVLRLVREHRGPIYFLSHIDPKERAYQNRLLAKYDLRIVEDNATKTISGCYTEVGYWRLARLHEGPGGGASVAGSSDGPLRR